MKDQISYKAVWTIRKFKSDEAYQAWKNGCVVDYEISRFDGNLLLNEGKSRLHNLLTGGGGNNYGNAAAYLGVGDSATAEAVTDTGLIAATNKFWRPMEATYPTFTSPNKTTWRAVFGSTEANYAWNEFTVVNASTDTGDNLNRKTSSQGTKTSGQTWTLDLEITWS